MTYDYVTKQYDMAAGGVSLSADGKTLKWSSTACQGYVLVKSRYRKDVSIEDLIKVLNAEHINLKECEKFRRLSNGIELMCITPYQYATNGGFRIMDRGVRYTVLSMNEGKDVIHIYEPDRDSVYPYFADISMKLNFTITEEWLEEGKTSGGIFGGFFRKKKLNPIRFYKVEAGDDYSAFCSDSDLFYDVGEYRDIPMIKTVLKERIFYVKSDVKPTLMSRNAGLKIELN